VTGINGNGKKLLPLILNIVFGVLVTIITMLTCYSLRQVTVNANRLTAVEASRFTASDGLTVWKEIANIQRTIAALPSSLPPPWFVDRVNKIEDRQMRILEAIGRLEKARIP